MRYFAKWLENRTSVAYNRSVQGKEFEPQTLTQAEAQVLWLASQIRGRFATDPRFNHDLVFKATDLMEQAAKILGSDFKMKDIGYEKTPLEEKQ